MKRVVPSMNVNVNQIIILTVGFFLITFSSLRSQTITTVTDNHSNTQIAAVMCNNLQVSTAAMDVSCNGLDDGSASAIVTGGVGPFSYSWSPGGGTSATIDDLVAGTYTVTVTDQSTLCVVSESVTVTQPDAVIPTLDVIGDILCFGDQTAGIDLTVNGGTAPYTFAWSNGENTEDISNIAAGTYSVIIIDANGCKAIGGVTILQPNPIDIDITSQTNISCNQPIGSVTIQAKGGTPPYQYSIDNGPFQGSGTFGGLSAGTYEITAIDSNGCEESIQITITDTGVSPTISGVQMDVSCFGGATGAIDIMVAGGTAPYSYLWSNGATTQDISGLTAGTYTVTVTDANGCNSSESFTLTQPANGLDLTAIQENVDCFGGANGSIDLMVAGGTAPYSYLWNNGATTEDISGLTAGTYSVTVTDANGCMSSESFTITQPSNGLDLTATLNNVDCFGGTTGSIDLMVAGGTAPYSYLWSNGATTEDISGLSAGNYMVTVMDANGCMTSGSYTITQPTSALNILITTTDETGPMTNDGSATVSVSGGTPPYTYLWSPGGQTTATISGLSDGTYTVTVTDANGCTIVGTAIIDEGDCNNLQVSAVAMDVSCNGLDDGSASAVVTGGVGPFSYSWSPGGETTATIEDLVAGTYTVTVTDQTTMCMVSESVTVAQPDAIILTLDVIGDILCFGDQTAGIDLTISGGTAPYTIAWSNGESTEDLMNIAAGTYSVIIIDANGCKAIGGVTILQPNLLDLYITSQTNITCGQGTGSVTVETFGGTPPYQYSIDNGPLQSSGTFDGLSAGTYEISVIDANGCEDSIQVTITDTGVGPTISGVQMNISCFGGVDGAIDITVIGNSAPYTYLWSNGATTQDISGLTAGIYTVTVTDVNGCATSESFTITQPAIGIVLTATQENVDCFGGATGSIDLMVAGGTAPYSYLWSNGATTEDINDLSAGTYTVTVTDANGCTSNESFTITQPVSEILITGTQVDDTCIGGSTGSIDITVMGGTAPYTYLWSNGATTEDISGLSAGTYSVTVTDANGCEAIEQFLIASSSGLMVSATQVDVACFGDATGSIDLTVTGGTAPYFYLWSNGATTEDIIGLTAGTYSVTVTDDTGCSITEQFMINEPASALVISGMQEDVVCFGDATGSIDLTITGGTAPYTYAWNNGATTEDITDLTAGTYTVTVTDAGGCSEIETFTIDHLTSEIMVMSTQQNVACFGASTGSIDITVSGGTAPYSYLWSNGATTEDLAGLSEGTFNVTITDANGCSVNVEFIITEPSSSLIIDATIEDVVCFGDDVGSIDLTVSGGDAPYNYLWSNGAITEDISNLAAGTYSVTVSDANGCEVGMQYDVGGPTEAIAIEIISQTDIECDQGTGTITLQASGGTAPYEYSLDGGTSQNNGEFTGLSEGSYNITVVDANGCEAIFSIEIFNNCIALIKSGTFNDENGDGCADIGETISYEFTVINNGNTLLTNIIVTDNLVTVDGGPIPNLAAGAIDTTTFTATYSIVQADVDAGQFTNQAVVEATTPSNMVIDDLSDDTSELEDDPTVTQLCQNPSISLEKIGVFNDENNDLNAQPGETVSYFFSVTNTGDVTLFDIQLSDDLPGIQIMGGPIAMLAPGNTDSTTFTGSYVITQADVNATQVVNQALIIAHDGNGNDVEDLSDDPNVATNVDANGDGDPDDPTVTILPGVAGAVFEIFNGITPDEDGLNDYFRVDGINAFPENTVKIYNRWGVLVFETDGYEDNDSMGANNFRGRSNGRATIREGELLPTGTYFYVITFPGDNGDINNPSNPGRTNYSGYLYINR